MDNPESVPSMGYNDSDLDISTSALSPARRIIGKVLTIITMVFAAAVVLPLIWVISDVVRRGAEAIVFPDILTQLPPAPGLSGGGVGHAIIGTIMVVSIATSLAVPIGVLAAIYLAEFGRGSRLAYIVKFAANVLAGVPSIICGLFAYGIVVLTQGSFSGFAGGVALAVLMLPVVLRSTEEALLLVPNEMRLAATGVGANQFQTTLQVVLPAAVTSIATGVVLAVARVAGDASAVLFTAFNNNFFSTDIWGPVATLPLVIYFFAIIPFRASQSLAWGASLVLLAMVLTFSIGARLLSRKQKF